MYLNAQGEQIPPPRTRDSSATPAAKRPGAEDGKAPFVEDGEEQRSSGGNLAQPVPAGEEWRSRDGGEPGWRPAEGRPFGPLDTVERDYALCSELLDSELAS